MSTTKNKETTAAAEVKAEAPVEAAPEAPVEAAPEAPVEAAPEAPTEPERIPYRLFKDSEKYTADVPVIINGVMSICKRGVDLELTPAQYEVLENSRIQDEQTARLIEEQEAQYKQRENALN